MNDSEQTHQLQRERAARFLADFFGARPVGYKHPPFALSAEPPLHKNQPEFWADAAWRIEPDQQDLLLLFLVRDTNIQAPARGPWRLDLLKVEQWTPGNPWEGVLTLLPADLPGVNPQGFFQRRTWWHSQMIPLASLKEAAPGSTLRLRVVFKGSYYPYDEPADITIYLETLLAAHPLPLGRAASLGQPRHWFYGDTHYHSVYTNDIKELGNPVPESCAAGRALGLDWLVITDHSCDLDDADPDVSPLSRWERLKADTLNPQVSNTQFRCILGEEISLLGAGDNLIHMLSFGGMDKMVEGAFMPDQGSFMSEVFEESIRAWLEKVALEGGYPEDETQRMFGRVHTFEEVLTMLPEETLLFAAHPFQLAQPPPPGKWQPENLTHPRLTGFEFWNTRIRRSTHLTLNPFGRDEWIDPGKQIENDRKRIKKVKAWADGEWDMALRKGLAGWSVAQALPNLRPVFLAGTDAHGSFNYSVGLSWDYRRRLMVDDDALGKVRTAVYLPEEHIDAIPPQTEILAAIRKGACVVTDGPIVTFSLAQHAAAAQLGEVLNAKGGEIALDIQAFSTPEFGAVEQVELVSCFRPTRKPRVTLIQKGESRQVEMDGAQGYCRLFAQTEGPDGQLFCCFTNPIWMRVAAGQAGKLVASYA